MNIGPKDTVDGLPLCQISSVICIVIHVMSPRSKMADAVQLKHRQRVGSDHKFNKFCSLILMYPSRFKSELCPICEQIG
jgi:hypothetical protein